MYQKRRVPELRYLLRERGLSTVGLKKDLIARLVAHDEGSDASKSSRSLKRALHDDEGNSKQRAEKRRKKASAKLISGCGFYLIYFSLAWPSPPLFPFQ